MTKYEILNFKMADLRRLKVVFLAITEQPIPRFSEIFALGSSFFYRNSVIGHIPAFHRTYLLFNKCNFGLPRAAPFVSSAIHLFYIVIKTCSWFV